jgi:hypothetical protein
MEKVCHLMKRGIMKAIYLKKTFSHGSLKKGKAQYG